MYIWYRAKTQSPRTPAIKLAAAMDNAVVPEPLGTSFDLRQYSTFARQGFAV
jgi:hypothetical protein